MRAYTWTDKALTRHAGRFVWLSLDMEKAKNAPARKQIGITAFPTLYVVDPSDGHVAIRWLGGASVAQLERLFDDGELAGAPGKAGSGGAKGPALEALIAADRTYGAEKFADACTQYSRALALAPANWPAYGRAVESLMSAYSEADSNEATCRAADAMWPRLQGTMSGANVASYALSAAVALPDSMPRRRDWLPPPPPPPPAGAGAPGGARGDAGEGGREREVRRAARGLRLAPRRALHRARPARGGDPDARAVAEGFPRRLQPLPAPGLGVQGDEAVARGARRLRPGARPRVRPAAVPGLEHTRRHSARHGRQERCGEDVERCARQGRGDARWAAQLGHDQRHQAQDREAQRRDDR